MFLFVRKNRFIIYILSLYRVTVSYIVTRQKTHCLGMSHYTDMFRPSVNSLYSSSGDLGKAGLKMDR